MSCRQRWLTAAGGIALAGIIGLYCVPGHPHAASGSAMDAVAHALAFAGVGVALGWSAARRRQLFIGLAVLAVALELLQRNLGGYADVEWSDVLANVAGVLCAWWVLASMGARPLPKDSRA